MGCVARKRDLKNAYIILVWKPGEKTLLRRRSRRFEGNLKINFGATGLGGVDGIHLANDKSWWRAIVNTVMSLRDP